jgi:hypothetical protein
MASGDVVISSGAILFFMYLVYWFEDARQKRCTYIREASLAYDLFFITLPFVGSATCMPCR